MDLTLDVENQKLNIRSAGVIIHNGKILVHSVEGNDHVCLPGGRVTIGENSQNTLKREILEELHKPIQIEKYLTTLENFFVMEGKKYHEIMFIYKFEFEKEEDKKITKTLENAEGRKELTYKWIDLNELEKVNLLPKCLQNIFKKTDYNRNYINIDK